MDRLTHLREEAGGSRDSTLDTSGAPSEAYITANDSSNFYSLSEEDSSFDISPEKDVSLASAADPTKSASGKDQLVCNLSTIPKKNDLLDSYKFTEHIEAANILSGGVDIFDDNDNSYDGDELVIDDHVEEMDDKSNSDLKLEKDELTFPKADDVTESETGVKETKATTPQVTETEVAETDITKTQVANTDVTELQVAEPNVSEKDVAELDVTKKEVAQSDVTETQDVETNVTETEVADVEVTETEVTESDVTETQVTEINIIETEVTELDVTETEMAELHITEAEVVAETGVSETLVAVADVTETQVAETDLTETEVESTVGSRDTEVMLHIDGSNVHGIEIGNGLYLYRKEGQEELAALQIISDDPQQPTFKFLKVRENAEGNLEVYEEIEIEVPTEAPMNIGKPHVNSASHLPIKDISKVINDNLPNKASERKKLPQEEIKPSTSKDKSSDLHKPSTSKSDINLTEKMVKFNEKRKSPVIHSTPNKEGVPLTKTMVDLHLHPNRHSDNVKTIEIHTTESNKQKVFNNKDATSEVKQNQNINEDNNFFDKGKDDFCKSDEVKKVTDENKQDIDTYTQNEIVTDTVQQDGENSTKSKSVTDIVRRDVDTSTDKKSGIDEVNQVISTSNERKDPNDEDKPFDIIDATIKAKQDVDTTFQDKKDFNLNTETNNEPVEKNENTEEEIADKCKSLVKSSMKQNETQSMIGNKTIQNPKVAETVVHNKTCSEEIHLEQVDTINTKSVFDKKTSNIDDFAKKVDTVQKPLDNNEKNQKALDNNEKNIGTSNQTKNKHDGLDGKSADNGAEDIQKYNESIAPDKSGRLLGNEKAIDMSDSHTASVNENNKLSESHENSTTSIPAKTDEILLASISAIQVNVTQEKEENKSDIEKETFKGKNKGTKNYTPIKRSDYNTTDNKYRMEKSNANEKNSIGESKVLEKNVDCFKLTGNSNKFERQIKAQETVSNAQVEEKSVIEKDISVIDVKPKSLWSQQNKEVKPDTSENPNPNDGATVNFVESKQGFLNQDIKNQTNLIKSHLNPYEPVKIIKNVMQEKIKTIPFEKPMNNNLAPVPFGQWTSVNRQDFLNRMKIKTSTNTAPTTKSIKQTKDLNRRDVILKIESMRQSNSSSSKAQEDLKLCVKTIPTTTSTSTAIPKSRESQLPVKIDASLLKNQSSTSTFEKVGPITLKKIEPSFSPSVQPRALCKSEPTQIPQKANVNACGATSKIKPELQPSRKEINNQDLIDKTIEGIINKVAPVKPEPKQPSSTKFKKEPNVPQKLNEKPTILDAIEMKMNELHGIPFVERPVHELPKVKTYGKSVNSKIDKVSKVPNLVPFTNKSPQKFIKETVIDLDSEEEVIEHEPVTGDIDCPKKKITPKLSATLSISEAALKQRNIETSKKETFITENDFDKFARRNSITYENCLTMNFEGNKQHNVVQYVVEKDKFKNSTQITNYEIKSQSQLMKPQQLLHPSKIQITSKSASANEDIFNKNYQSKLQQAYQSALTVKSKQESPITIIEDKPVKVVFMDSNVDVAMDKLNVQGKELSPSKKHVLEPETFATRTYDDLDSEVLDADKDSKMSDDVKIKTKHIRKQVLTPVQTPELELIQPGDIEASPKKKRRTDEYKSDKSAKNVVPKKSYLLSRSTDVPNDSPLKEAADQFSPIVSHSTASAIDSLVKAAELLETQDEISKSNSNVPLHDTNQTPTPVKRGRGRPRKYPLPEGTPEKTKVPSPQKKPRLIDAKSKTNVSDTDENDSSDESVVQTNWTMGRINENIVCPICNKLFRSENVVFKHVKHCTGPSPNRSDSDSRSTRRRSRISLESDSKSVSKPEETDADLDKLNSKNTTPKKRKPKDIISDAKDDVIVIEDTPTIDKPDKEREAKPHESRKVTKTKAQYKTSLLSCEYCGKSFRQLSYLASHKLLHKKEISKLPEKHTERNEKSIFCCEVCKKEFRKLHHLVQHRVIHNPTTALTKPARKISSEQSGDNQTSKQLEPKQIEDHSAAFRCEPCDKSFRKLHHLVEHRETHDGINRQKSAATPQAPDKTVPVPPPQCDVCLKTFRKLHHLIEHKEQHLDTNSERSDDKSVKSALSTKDIIHECSLCYMVFPNEHSLNKHIIICQRKKRQSASKLAKEIDVTEVKENQDDNKSKMESTVIVEDVIELDTPKKPIDNLEIRNNTMHEKTEDFKQKRLSKDESDNPKKPEETLNKRDLELVDVININEFKEVAPQKTVKVDDKLQDKLKVTVIPKKKMTPKKKITEIQRRKSNIPLSNLKQVTVIESSDDDEVRYMLNPDFKEQTTESKVFMKVKAKKRNSLQFERPDSKDLVKRRTSLQPPKLPRLKSKSIEAPETPVSLPTNVSKVKLETVPASDSDDSDVKYSFPESKPKETPKAKKKIITEKKKTLSGIARKKSTGKPAAAIQKPKTSPDKPIKKRREVVEHRCDCGQLFSSAALLWRHASLAHTPPRRRRLTPAAPPAPSQTHASKPAELTQKPREQTKQVVTSARRAGRPVRSAHSGVPVPDAMRRYMERLRK